MFVAANCVRRLQGKGRGKGAHKMAVPMELLQLEKGQKRRGLLIGDQQANLVRKAAQPPDVKRKDIADWMGKAANSFKSVQTAFNLQIDSQPAMVEGRLLPAPVIQYGHPKNYYAGTTGAWNMIDVRCLATARDLPLRRPCRKRSRLVARSCCFVHASSRCDRWLPAPCSSACSSL